MGQIEVVKPSVPMKNSLKVVVTSRRRSTEPLRLMTSKMFFETDLVDDAMIARADLLAMLLRHRLANHKSEKMDANKQSHFTLGWFLGNVSCVAAIAVLANHVRDEPVILVTKMLAHCSIQPREWITSF